MLSAIPYGNGPGGISYMYTTGEHAIQPTPPTSPRNWPLHHDPMTSHSPSPVPTTSNSPLQSVISDPPSLSANSSDYTWVPQRQYALTAHHFTPTNPITFNVDSGEPGIRLSDAYNRRFTELRDRDDLVFESSRSPTITMRLEVCDLPKLAWTLADGA